MFVDVARCVPTWVTQGDGTCPYGIALPGEITLLKDPGVVDIIGVIYGYTAYVVCLLLVINLGVRRGSRQLATCALAAFMPLLNEVFIKPLFAEPRPGAFNFLQDSSGRHVGSCVPTCGMPSSHATISIGLWVFLLLDAAARVVPLIEAQPAGDLEAATDVAVEGAVTAAWPVRAWARIMPADVLSTHRFITFVAFWSIALLPVPLMRVRTYDHTAGQALAGSVAGILYAFIWHRAMTYLANRCSCCLGDTFCKVFTHNYAPAVFRIQIFEHKGVQHAKLELIGPQEWKERHGLSGHTEQSPASEQSGAP